MKKVTATIAAIALMGSVATGCSTSDTNSGAIGAGVGTVAAVVAGANASTILLSAAAGAAAGVIIGRVAKNSNDCYYANGKGGYYKAAC